MSGPEKLNIDTPEQINLEYELAGPGSRFMALFVDLLLQAVAVVVLIILLAILGIFFNPFRASRTLALVLLIFVVFILQWGYFAFFEIVWKGQTPGKRQAGIRVINETGRQASLYEAIARNLVRTIDSLPGPYALGALVMFLSPQSKRIGDYVAGTVVVHDRKPEQEHIFFNTSAEDVIGAINYSALTAKDLELIEAFLQRRLDIPFEVRQRTAAKLAEHFRAKCGVPDGAHADSENMLEVLVRGCRQNARFRRAEHSGTRQE